VTPDGLDTWMKSSDPAAQGRAFRALLGMGKLDVAALRRAFEGP
jgi:hypothetical protein